MRPLIYAIHGILTRQTVADWPDQFAAWVAANGDFANVEKREYHAGPFPSWNVFVKNRLLAKACAAEIEEFSDRFGCELPVSFVAHSNGTDIALKTVKLLAARGIPTHTLIVVGSVLSPHVEKNGVDELIRDGMLNRAFAYCSSTDHALAVESYLPWCAYKNLGRVGWYALGGPTDGYKLEDGIVCTRRFLNYDHGTYFENAHREQTFAQFRKDMNL